MQRVRLQHLTEMQQAAQLGCDRRELLYPSDLIDRFRRCQLVADRADAAQALHEERHFPVRAALDEFLKTAELDDMEARFDDVVVIVDQQRDFAVPFDTRDRIDGNAAGCRRCGFVWLHSA